MVILVLVNKYKLLSINIYYNNAGIKSPQKGFREDILHKI
tara:strand:+ start:1166 stop:1285 length:120 start_codon:yes stop_codon:yes gene_type:complete